MKGRILPSLRAWCAAALLALPLPQAAAQAKAAPAPGLDLYQQALQAISEGRNRDASAMLMRAIESEPLHAGAWLELALLQCALGHGNEAEQLFRTIEQRFDPPPGIVELITRSRAQGCSAWQPQSQVTVVAGRGIDQNVNQGASNPRYTVINEDKPAELLLTGEFLPQHDGYNLLAAEYRRDLTPNGTVGFVQMQSRRNDSMHKYDNSALTMGADSAWRFGRWTASAGGALGVVSFGGELFQRQLQLQGRMATPLALPLKPQLQLSANLVRMRYPTLDNFDATSAEFRSQLAIRHGNVSVNAGAAVQSDHASGARPGGDRRGWQLSLQSRLPIGGPLSAELGLSQQTWNSDTPYAPGLIDTVRRQRTRVLRASLSYALDRSNSLVLETRLIRNAENISIFQYNNRVLQLAWQWNGW
ncbi:tetratricopeptide repeat protein [Massilia sp. MS-15]|uniref:tetratricopeptide repeat protein n=1 Tax=Massilia sp. MS-15 TaxID=2878200 RepID=UPI001CD4A87A|nr:tetratricopeptide repeat protein [Massilia sp. MS-15]MCA1248321.1 tetratricopeptide repeat protein [Massilia sp. MS-15]